jgi:hypothetical protein
MTLGIIIFDKTFNDGVMSSHKNCMHHHKFATVSRLTYELHFVMILVSLCDIKNSVIINSSASLDFMTLQTFSSYYGTLYDKKIAPS